MKRVRLFRHGETDWNAQLRMQGHADVPLNKNGREQAAALAAALKPQPIEAVFSSDLLRARETAQAVADAVAATLIAPDVTIDVRLRETALGQAEGLTLDEAMAQYGEETIRKWRSHLPEHQEFSFPGGEMKSAALARIRDGLESLLTATPAREIAACTHGGVLRRLIHWIKPGLPKDVHIKNCEVFEFEFDPSARLWRALF